MRNPEHREQPHTVDLRIIPPEGDKHVMIGFDAGKNEEQNEAYNRAIDAYLKRLGPSYFHQIGADGSPGLSAWEIWTDDLSDAELQDLVQKIERAAKTWLSDDEEAQSKLNRELYPHRYR